jgi:DNA-binding IclR family transcriptional regulator
MTDTDLKSEQVIPEWIDSEFVLSNTQWVILKAAQGSAGVATDTTELAKTTGLDNATVYQECVILRDTGYMDFTDDSHGMAMLKITGHGLLALRERDRLTRK